jgi:hypothetical protein
MRRRLACNPPTPRAGVNCSGCHKAETEGAGILGASPDHKVCTDCPRAEVKGFLAGKHGMRLAESLAPMTPGAGAPADACQGRPQGRSVV